MSEQIVIHILYCSIGTNGCLNKGMLMMDRINPSSDDNMGTIMKVMTGKREREKII